MAPALSQPIYLITDGAKLRREGRLLSVLEKALHGGEGRVGFVQLREQLSDFAASDREILDLASACLLLCQKYGAKFILNGRADLAKACNADGVHCNKRSISLPDARAFLGDSFLLGYSAHSIEEADEVCRAGANYVFLSPIFSPLSKNDERTPLGLSSLKILSNYIQVPLFALGGITAENLPSVRQAGASGIATITSVLLAPEPNQACRDLVHAWEGVE